MSQKLRLITATAALALLVAACGSSSTTPAAPASTAQARTGTATTVAAAPAASAAKPVSGHATVAIRNFMYFPMHLTVTAGTRVSFHNDDQTAHTATAINQAFDSGTIQPDKTATVTFRKPGTYAYHCLFHAFMTASITVVAAST